MSMLAADAAGRLAGGGRAAQPRASIFFNLAPSLLELESRPTPTGQTYASTIYIPRSVLLTGVVVPLNVRVCAVQLFD